MASDASIDDAEKTLAAKLGDGNVDDAIKATVAKVGENIELKRVGRVAAGQGVSGGYIHAGGKLGVVVALGSARLLRGLLYGVAPADPTSFALAAGLLLIVALVASVVPARRALAVDPVVALREE